MRWAFAWTCSVRGWEKFKIKNTDVVGVQIAGHAFSMALSGDISLDDHTVITSDRTINLVSVFIRK